jgi:hypothetical protein
VGELVNHRDSDVIADPMAGEQVAVRVRLYRAAAASADDRGSNSNCDDSARRDVLQWIMCRCREYPLTTALSLLGLAVFVSGWLSPDPARAGFTHLPTMPFYPALILTGLLAGRRAACCFAAGALLFEAVWLPPPFPLAIEAKYVPFLVEFAVSLLITIVIGCWWGLFGGDPANGPPDAGGARLAGSGVATGVMLMLGASGVALAPPLDQQFNDPQRGVVVGDRQAGARALQQRVGRRGQLEAKPFGILLGNGAERGAQASRDLFGPREQRRVETPGRR